MPNISDVDDIVSWVLQQLQPGQKEFFNKATESSIQSVRQSKSNYTGQENIFDENIYFGKLIQIYHNIIDQAVSCENVEAKDFVPWVQGRPCRVVVAILRQLSKVDVPVLQFRPSFMMVDHAHGPSWANQ